MTRGKKETIGMPDFAENPEFKAGVVAGKLSAMEARLDRLEHQIDIRLAGIESKLEGLVTQIASRDGERFLGGRLLHWLLTLAVSAAGWLYAGVRH
jgi:hypothetical protein